MNEEQFEGQSPLVEGAGAEPAWLKRAQNNWKIYPIIAAVVTVVIVAMWWYISDREQQNAEASAHLSRIRAVYEAGELEASLTADTVSPIGGESIMGLIAISDQYSGTDAGKVAALMAGNALATLGRFEEAQVHFDRASSSDAQVVEVGGLQGLASCKEAAGDFTGAASLYEKAGQKALKTGLEGQCFYRAGLCYEESGDTKKAGELYIMVAKKYEVSDAAPSARMGLARLGMAID
jgi:tetratricopeptide (TPR) repeat protein